MFSEELINKTIEYFETKGRPIQKEGATNFLSSLADLADLVCRPSSPSRVGNPAEGGIPLT